jgi:hypothetical protein
MQAARVAAAVSRDAVLLVFLNLVDAVFTLSFLHLGVAEEANPLMRAAWNTSPMVFMVVKLMAVNAGALLLWTHRDARAARVALKGGALLYAGIAVWHLAFLATLVRSTLQLG